MILSDLQAVGLAIADETILSRPGSYRLLDQQLEGRLLNKRAAWITELQGAEGNPQVIVCVDKRFPFSLPQVYLSTGSQFEQYPHVNKRGKICLLRGNPGIAHRDPKSVMEWALDSAAATLQSTDEPSTRQEFIDEFAAYWNEIVDDNKSAITLFDPGQGSRKLFYWENGNHLVFADCRQKLKRWLTNSGWQKANFRFREGVFIWLAEPVTASEFPGNGHELFRLLEQQPSDLELLSAVVPNDKPGQLPVVVGFNTNNGIALATVVLHEPTIQSSPFKRKLLVEDGFSKRSHIPRPLLSNRYLTNAALTRLRSNRFDSDWQDFRTGNSMSQTLRDKRVCIIGCGALGSHLAYALARAGVGHLRLIDDDTLSSDNARRHLLGMEYLAQYKVRAVKSFIQKQLPDVDIEAHPNSWEELVENTPSLLIESDVVISTTGDWACEEALNLVKMTNSLMPATIFSCIETFGLSGQALAVVGNGGCLACATSPTGRSIYEATVWNADTDIHRQAGACGDQFLPFGFTEVGPVSDMVARLAIDVLSGKLEHSELRGWVGDKEQIEELGGEISGVLSDLLGAEIKSNSSFAVALHKRSKCNVCEA